MRIGFKSLLLVSSCVLTSCSFAATLNVSETTSPSTHVPSVLPSIEPSAVQTEESVVPSLAPSYWLGVSTIEESTVPSYEEPMISTIEESTVPSYEEPMISSVEESIVYSVQQSETTPLDFYKVSYYVKSSLYDEKYVLANQLAENIVPPTYENEKFIGWYKDINYTYAFDFSSYLTQDVNLYARYDVDYEQLTNTITTSIMKSVVTVQKSCYNTSFLGGTEGVSATGSGIIYKEDNRYYYALTNNHVVYPISGYRHVDYSVIDYLGNELSVSNVYRDPDYDLAVVKFSKGEDDLTDREFTIKENVIISGTPVIALGQPQGQRNAITYGKVNCYTGPGELVNASSEQNNIQFNVLEHTAYTSSGSSGGPLLDINFNIVGINYASAYVKGHEGGFSDVCYAVPGYKVVEFLYNQGL